MMICEDFKTTKLMCQDFARLYDILQSNILIGSMLESDQLVIVKLVLFTACTM